MVLKREVLLTKLALNSSFSFQSPCSSSLNFLQTLPGKENELMNELFITWYLMKSTKETDIARKLPLEHVLHVAELFQVSL